MFNQKSKKQNLLKKIAVFLTVLFQISCLLLPDLAFAAKPSSGATLDTGNALYTNLLHVWAFLEGSGGTSADSKGTNTLTLNHGSWQTDADGPIWRTTLGNVNQPIGLATKVTFGGTANWSLAWRAKQALDNNRGIILGDITPTLGSMLIWQRGGNYLRVYFNSGSIMAFTSQTSFTTLVDYVLTYKNAGGEQQLRLYKDGVEVADSPLQVSDVFKFDTLFQYDSEGDDLGFVGDFSYLYVWDGRVISGAEAATIDSDPYAIFSAGGGGGATVVRPRVNVHGKIKVRGKVKFR